MPLRTDVYVPIMMEIAISVTMAARRHGYDVLLITNDEGPDGVRRVAGSGLADGVILMDVELDDERIPVLRAQGSQAALIGLPDDAQRTVLRGPRLRRARVRSAPTTWPISATARSRSSATAPASTTGTPAMPSARSTGFRDAAERRGLRFLHRSCEGTYESTAGALARILADRPGTTGFVVQNEGAIGPLLTCCAAAGGPSPRTPRWSRCARSSWPSSSRPGSPR